MGERLEAVASPGSLADPEALRVFAELAPTLGTVREES
jgi:hypothetical protein